MIKIVRFDRLSAHRCILSLSPDSISFGKGWNNTLTWSKWQVVRGNLDNEGKWETKQTEEMRPRGDQVRLIIQCNADVAASISAGHYDDLVVEQDMDSEVILVEPSQDRLLKVAAVLREQADILTELVG